MMPFLHLQSNYYIIIIHFKCTIVNMQCAQKVHKLAVDRYEGLKSRIIAQGLQGKLPEFCTDYINDELISTRTSILANVGITYETYADKYIGQDPE